MIAVIFLGVFLVLMVFAGIWGMKKTSSVNDFFLGGRTIGPWISAFAYGTSYFSAVVFIGFAGKLGWGFGLNALWIALGNALIGSLAAWLVLGKRTRIMTMKLSAMTMPEFLEKRYGCNYIKMYAAVIIFIFLLPYSASVFKGLGYLFEANFNISFDLALLIMTLITGLYLVLGGYFAITLTDFIQGIIMLAGSVLMVLFISGINGGLAATISLAAEKYIEHVPSLPSSAWLVLGATVIMTSFGIWGMPQMVQKFYSIKDEKTIYIAAAVSTVFALIIVFSAYVTGSFLHVFFDAPLMLNGKPAFDLMIPELLTRTLPELLMAVILLLVLSASMSTLSSLVLVSASAVSIDLYQGYIRKNASKKETLFVIRLLSAVFIILSLLIAKYNFSFIVTLISLSWGVVSGSFMAVYVYGLFSKKVSRAGAWAGLLTGIITEITLFSVLGPDKAPIAAVAAMAVPFLTVPLVSAFTKKPDEKFLKELFS
jgi:SSS family solute:Na+ symporter